jgi:hypothetical protein
VDVLDDDLDNPLANGDHLLNGLALIFLALEPLHGTLELTTLPFQSIISGNDGPDLSLTREAAPPKERMQGSALPQHMRMNVIRKKRM